MISNLPPHRAYKPSGIPWLGDIPAHWDVAPGLAAYRQKQVRNMGMVEKQVLSLSYGRIVIKPPEKLHGLVPASFETYQIVDPGEIIIRPTDLQNDWNSLRVGIARDRGIITSAYLCLRAVGDMTSEYGYLLLNAYDLMKIFYGMGSGLRQNLDYGRDLKRMPVPIPPLPEQTAIARYLDHVDRRIRRYIKAKQKLIKLLAEQKQAIIHQAVTGQIDARSGQPYPAYKDSGVEWLGQVPAHWEVLPFTKCATERSDYRGATPEKVDSGVFLVTAKNIRMGWIDYEVSQEYVREDRYDVIMRRGIPTIGDILLTTEAPLGNVALVDNDSVAFAQRIIRFRMNPELILSKYALYSMISQYFQSQLRVRATGSTAHGIKASKLPQLQIVCPTLSEQHCIVNAVEIAVSQVDTAIDRTQREIDLIREYRTRLIADAVTGKVDVRAAAANLPEETGAEAGGEEAWEEEEDEMGDEEGEEMEEEG